MATLIHDPLPIEHYVMHQYQAKCSCGWLGVTRWAEEAAQFDLEEHQYETQVGNLVPVETEMAWQDADAKRRD